ncbi:hypothetical protein CS542_09940 [Pedobacter sp. IW39]|nr:hypothetical protein CS542_09940 [Pedobacter sp. IW39]
MYWKISRGLSGVKFKRFSKDQIFDPLEMEDTYFHLPKGKLTDCTGSKVDVNKETKRADWRNEVNHPAADGFCVSGGAGLSSTTSDYLKFFKWYWNKGL